MSKRRNNSKDARSSLQELLVSKLRAQFQEHRGIKPGIFRKEGSDLNKVSIWAAGLFFGIFLWSLIYGLISTYLF